MVTNKSILLGLGAIFMAGALGSCMKMFHDSHQKTEEQSRKSASLPQHVFYAPDQYKAAITKMNELKGTGCVFEFETGSGKHADRRLWLYKDFNKLGDCAHLAQQLAQGRPISSYKFHLTGHQPDQFYANGQCGWRDESANKSYCYALTAQEKYFIEFR